MSRIVDNLIAYRILKMLVTPFEETEAYKNGIIDEKGKNLRRFSSLETSAEKNSYTFLHRLVFNLKKMINRLPGGESKLKNLLAAFFLIKETLETGDKSFLVLEQKLHNVINVLDDGYSLVEEENVLLEFLSLFEEMNVVAGAAVDKPKIKPRNKRFKKLNVKDDTFKKMSAMSGSRKIKSLLNIENYEEKCIHSFLNENAEGIVILINEDCTKELILNN